MAEDKSERFWSRHAGDYDAGIDEVIGRESRQAVYQEVLGLSDLGHVVEFGCGPGYFTRAIAKNADRVLAIDLSDRMLDQAKDNLRAYRNVSFQKADCERTAFPPDSFDTVFTANVVQILEHPERALKEAFRILKPGGSLIVLYFTGYGMSVFDRFVFMIRFLRRFGMAPCRRMIPLEEIRAIAEAAGLRVEDLRLIGGKVKAVFLRARKPERQ